MPLVRRAAIALFAVVLLSAFLAGPAQAATLTFTPNADAYSRSDYPDANYGSQTTLRIDNSPISRSYLRFNVQGLTRSVRKATLRVFAQSTASSSGIELRSSSSSWGETTLTYRNAPSVGSSADRTGAFSAGQWVTLDATPLVRANGTVSLALTTASSSSRTLASREDPAYRPQLIVEERPHLAGAQLHPLWGDASVAGFDRELDMARAAGMDTVRVDLGWSTLEERGKGQFSQWYVDKADTFFQHAKDRGIRVIATFLSTPCWASSAPEELKQGCAGSWWSRGVQTYPPTRPADYADAAEWVARRWGDKLHAIEIWNEPNMSHFLKGPDPAASYAGMLKAAYPRIKAARPALLVLGGALLYSDGNFLTDLYDRLGIKGSYDGISYHPYNQGRDPDDVTAPAATKYSYQLGTKWMRDIMVAHGDSAVDLWITEVGFPTCTLGAHPWCVTQDKQAEYTVDNYRIARERWPFVRAVITYNLRNKGTAPSYFEDQMGLLWRDFTAKPAYNALAAELKR